MLPRLILIHTTRELLACPAETILMQFDDFDARGRTHAGLSSEFSRRLGSRPNGGAGATRGGPPRPS